jgi:hypothetical protein
VGNLQLFLTILTVLQVGQFLLQVLDLFLQLSYVHLFLFPRLLSGLPVFQLLHIPLFLLDWLGGGCLLNKVRYSIKPLLADLSVSLDSVRSLPGSFIFDVYELILSHFFEMCCFV